MDATKPAWLLLGLCIVYYCLDYYFRISPSLVIIPLMHQYDTTPLGIGSFASAFYIGYVLLQLPSGAVLDRFPLNRVIAGMMVLCTLSFIGFIFAHLFWEGMALRCLLGATSALSFISVLFIARHYLPLRYFAFISGLTIAAGTFAASLAQITTSIGMDYFNWKSVFLVTSLIGIIIAVFVFLTGKSLTQIKYTKKTYFANINLLLKNKKILLNGLVGGLFYLPTSVFAAVWGVTFLQLHDEITRTQSSMGITFLFAGWAIGSPLVGLWSNTFKKSHYLMSVSAILATVVSIILLFIFTKNLSLIYLLLFLFGLFSSAQVLVWKIFHECCPKTLSGTGIAVTNMIIMLLVAIAHPMVGWMLTKQHNGLVLIPVAFILSAVISFLL